MSDYITAYEDDCYKCDIDFYEDLPFFHVEVKKDLSISDVKKGREIFDTLKGELKKLGRARLYAYHSSEHFAKLIGGGYINIPVIGGEKDKQLIVWELEED